MIINYDKKVDSLNLTLKVGKVAKTLEVAPDVFLDVDKNGNPLYVEIVGVSEKIGKETFSTVHIGGKSFHLPVVA